MRHHPLVNILLFGFLWALCALFSPNSTPPTATAQRDVSVEIVESPTPTPTFNEETMWACAPNRTTPKVISSSSEHEAQVTVYIFEQNGERVHEYMTCTGPYSEPTNSWREYST